MTDESINNIVSSWSHLKFHEPNVLDMCENVSKDVDQNIIALKAYPEHPLFSAKLEDIMQGTTEEQLKYLIVHGYSGEAIYSQAGISK
jgi:hypothetical protein